jgi:hypothetical protein
MGQDVFVEELSKNKIVCKDMLSNYFLITLTVLYLYTTQAHLLVRRYLPSVRSALGMTVRSISYLQLI